MNLKNEIFAYYTRKRKTDALIMISIGIVFVIIVLVYLAIFWGENPFANTFIDAIIKHVSHHIASLSLLGMFYVTFFGGLFFLTVPIEPIFILALPKHNPLILLFVVLAGAIISYSVDYLLGLKFSTLSKKLVSVKQFYKMKSMINKRGAIAILLLNIIGVGSQQMTFIMGVFKYNKSRLALVALTGQLIKYSIIIALFYIF